MRTKALIFVFFAVVGVVGMAGPSTNVEAQGTSDAPPGRSGDATVGASIFVPEDWTFEREPYTLDGTVGFTVWEPHVHGDHGGRPAARVALAPELRPGEIEGRIRQRISEYPDLPLGRTEVRVGEKKLKGVAVGTIPGGDPSVEIYVPVDGRVYQINVYSEKLNEADTRLLSTLRFERPSRSASAAGLPDGDKAETYYVEDGEDLTARESAAREASGTREAAAVPTYKERKIAEGCWLAQSPFFFQTQHGWFANRDANDRGTNAPTGYTMVGQPNYWGQYTHGNLGYGRCDKPKYTNDKFAVDYPLNEGDPLFSPFKSGTVTFAGRRYGHRHYGIFVVIKADNGKYVSMSAHLNALAKGIKRGAKVTDATVIGYAGKTGDPSIPVGEVHLHQAFYRYPSYTPEGAPYGGAGLKVVYHRYMGCPKGENCGKYRPSGVYEFVERDVRQTSAAQKTEGEYISN